MSSLILQSITRALPTNFVRTLAQDIEWAYKEAHEASYGDPLLDPCDSDYHYPHYRRSILEKRLRDSAARSGLVTALRWNNANNYQFTEIEANDWVFTLKHTNDEKYMLKSSIFREQNAALNGMLPQLVMPSILGLEKEQPKRQFSAIIFHATDRYDVSAPGFVRIGVPKEDFSWWEVCYDIHELMVEAPAEQTQEEIEVVAKWKTRAARNASTEK